VPVLDRENVASSAVISPTILPILYKRCIISYAQYGTESSLQLMNVTLFSNGSLPENCVVGRDGNPTQDLKRGIVCSSDLEKTFPKRRDRSRSRC
jgi:hypothetical protein